MHVWSTLDKTLYRICLWLNFDSFIWFCLLIQLSISAKTSVRTHAMPGHSLLVILFGWLRKHLNAIDLYNYICMTEIHMASCRLKCSVDSLLRFFERNSLEKNFAIFSEHTRHNFFLFLYFPNNKNFCGFYYSYR